MTQRSFDEATTAALQFGAKTQTVSVGYGKGAHGQHYEISLSPEGYSISWEEMGGLSPESYGRRGGRRKVTEEEARALFKRAYNPA